MYCLHKFGIVTDLVFIDATLCIIRHRWPSELVSETPNLSFSLLECNVLFSARVCGGVAVLSLDSRAVVRPQTDSELNAGEAGGGLLWGACPSSSAE